MWTNLDRLNHKGCQGGTAEPADGELENILRGEGRYRGDPPSQGPCLPRDRVFQG